jgi:CheY-like chemotaxis protein
MNPQNEKEPGFDSKPGATHPLRILMAEDHPVNQKVAQVMLAKLGYDSTAVADGLQAVAEAGKGVYDLILMDVQMPEMDGLQATVEIRKLKVPQPRIVAVTANADATDRQACMTAGMDGILKKPIQPTDLRELLLSTKQIVRATTEDFSTGIVSSLRGPDGDPKALGVLFASYFAEARKSLAQMEEALAADDPAGLRKAAHYLKGSSDVLGAARLAELCRSLEHADSLKDAGIRNTLDEIARVIVDAEIVAKKMVAAPENSVNPGVIHTD